MSSEKKSILLTCGGWLVLMAVVYLVRGYPDFWWFLGCAWVCLIVSGVLILTWEHFDFTSRKQTAARQDTKRFDGIQAYAQGVEYYKQKKLKDALVCFNMAIECGYDKNVYGLRADCLFESGLHSMALRDYNTAISKSSEDCNLYFQRSITLIAIGDTDGAISDLEEAVRLSRIDNDLNCAYRDGAKDIGWPNGHTAFYESHLQMEKARKKMSGGQSS
jgi:tetratricopeptide (TPR) repeat protein